MDYKILVNHYASLHDDRAINNEINKKIKKIWYCHTNTIYFFKFAS